MTEDVAIYRSTDKAIYTGRGQCFLCGERNVITDSGGCEECNVEFKVSGAAI